MELYRKTYAEVNLKKIETNVKKIISRYQEYKYRFAVVKADAYGRGILPVSHAVKNGGCNYFAVATLEEAMEIRKEIKDIPILCLGVVHGKFLNKCIENNITITINSMDYLNSIIDENIEKLKIHIKINTGMNRLGISSVEEFEKVFKVLKERNAYIEGIFTHIYDASSKKDYLNQISLFKEMLDYVPEAKKIPIIHVPASEALEEYPKLDFVNGYRLGKIMYGFSLDDKTDLESTFKLYSEIIQINELKKGDVLGYNANYVAKKDIKIGVVPIGYEDGIIRDNTGRYVYIGEKKYQIIRRHLYGYALYKDRW